MVAAFGVSSWWIGALRTLFVPKSLAKVPKGLYASSAFLSIVGLVVMFSISHHYFWRHLVFTILGCGVVAFVAALRPTYLLRFAYIAHFASIACLCFVLIHGEVVTGASRWIDFYFVKFQPSELAKLTIILAVARYYNFNKSESVSVGLLASIPPLLMVFLTAGLIIVQPDLGSGLIVIIIGLMTIFLAGLKMRSVILCALLACALSPIVWLNLYPYQKQRIKTFISPSVDSLGVGYNISQSQITIGSGGKFGKGLMNSSQSRLGFLPESHTDFAFTVFAEEFGLAGVLIVFLAFAFLIYCFYNVGHHSPTVFVRLACGGIACMLFTHVIVNAAMVCSLIPVVGSPMPFFSYGGTFAILNYCALGVVFNVAANSSLGRDLYTSI